MIDNKKDNGINLYGKVAKFPKNVKASKAYNYLENIKMSKSKIWYIMIEKDDSELQIIKYNNKQGFNLKEFCEKLKDYYSHNESLVNYIANLEIVGEEKFSIIKNIPDIYIDDKKLITIIVENMVKLLYD